MYLKRKTGNGGTVHGVAKSKFIFWIGGGVEQYCVLSSRSETLRTNSNFKYNDPANLLHLRFHIQLHSTRITTVIRLCDVSVADIFLLSNACRSGFFASSCVCGTGGHFPGTGQSHKRDHLLYLLLKFRMHGPKPPPPPYVFTAWCLTKYRENISFICV